jgi:hypothetical protein
VAVDAEDLLDDDDGALGLSLRIGAVGAELMLIGGAQREVLAQGVLLSMLCGFAEAIVGVRGGKGK